MIKPATNPKLESLTAYESSGRVSLRILPVLLLAGIPCALLMGWAYAHAVAQISWAPLSVLVAGFLCVLVGLVIYAILKAGHSRSQGFNRIAAGGLALVTLWARWITTLLMYRHSQQAAEFAVSGPPGWARILGDFAAWTHTASPDQLSVGLQAFGWALECLVMVTMSAWIGKAAAQAPYSETARAWAKKSFAGELFWPGGNSDALLDRLKQQGTAALLQLLRAAELTQSSIASQWWTVSVEGHWVESDPGARWLRVDVVVHARDDAGKVKSTRQTVLDMWQVGEADYSAVADHLANADHPSPEAEDSPPPQNTDPSAQPTPVELEPAVTALDSENFASAIVLAQAHCQHPLANVRADAHRLCALAHCRLMHWQDAFEHYHTLFALEPSAFNALQLATTSVMCGQLLRGQAWFDKADEINRATHELPPPRLHTAFVSALEQAGELAAAKPHLDWLADAYRSAQTTDDHRLWMYGLPFFADFLNKSLPILRACCSEQDIKAWYVSMCTDLDDDGKAAIDRHLAASIQAP